MAAYSNETDHTIFNMSGLISFKSEDKASTISFGCYNGRPQITIFRGQGNKVLKRSITPKMFLLIKRICTNLLKNSAPGSMYSLRNNNFIRDSRKWDAATIFTIGIDENGIFYFEYKDVSEGPSCRFPIKGSQAVEMGTEVETAASRSKVEFESFFDVFKDLQVAAFFTRNNLYNPYSSTGRDNTAYSPAKPEPAPKPSEAPAADDSDLYF
jgi:hypothetical protein